MAGLLVATDVRGRAEIRSDQASAATASRQLAEVQGRLTRAEHRLTVARGYRAAVTGAVDAAQSSLTTTRDTLSRLEADIRSQGVDLGALDTCLNTVEQALNQFAVGQTVAGLASLRASSPACAALNEAG